ncbi:MAG TPA: YciI family protein [Gemmatimonadaceae bacterium]|nr:YciI family protein [Gemmatimonadaceae bacterium]
MRYMMFVCVDPAAEKYVPDEDNIEDWVEEMDRRKVRVLGNRLKDVKDATTVRRRRGKVVVTDGPFVESKEWIAGFDILECDNLDAAIEIAAKHPMARFGKIEIRPFWPEQF